MKFGIIIKQHAYKLKLYRYLHFSFNYRHYTYEHINFEFQNTEFKIILTRNVLPMPILIPIHHLTIPILKYFVNISAL